MATNTARKRRTTPELSINGLSRNSTFIDCPPNPTVCDNTPNGRDQNGKALLLGRNKQHLVSRLSPCCQQVSPVEIWGPKEADVPLASLQGTKSSCQDRRLFIFSAP